MNDHEQIQQKSFDKKDHNSGNAVMIFFME